MLSIKKLVLAYSLLGVLALVNAYPLATKFIQEDPYWDVVEVEYPIWGTNNVEVSYSFYKNGACEIKTFAVVGFSAGIPRYLRYTDLDGLKQNFDREKGQQGLNIKIWTNGDYYESIEIRTRHLCGSDVVQRVFATIYKPGY